MGSGSGLGLGLGLGLEAHRAAHVRCEVADDGSEDADDAQGDAEADLVRVRVGVRARAKLRLRVSSDAEADPAVGDARRRDAGAEDLPWHGENVEEAFAREEGVALELDRQAHLLRGRVRVRARNWTARFICSCHEEAYYSPCLLWLCLLWPCLLWPCLLWPCLLWPCLLWPCLLWLCLLWLCLLGRRLLAPRGCGEAYRVDIEVEGGGDAVDELLTHLGGGGTGRGRCGEMG